MSRLLKILLAVVGVVVVLLLGVAVAVLLLVDPNEYRGEIAAAVEEQTGRSFAIDGELGLRILPCCAVAIDDTRLGNPEGFDALDFASVSSVRLGLQLLPLLFEQRVVVDEVTLDGLNVKLHRRADGVANWTFDAGPAAEAPPPETEAGDAELPELSVAGVRITDAQIELRDDVAGTHFAVEQLNVKTGPVAVGEPVDLDVSLRVKDYASEATVDGSFSAKFLLSTEEGRAELLGIESTAAITAPDLPADGVSVTMRGVALRTDLESGAAELEGIVSTIAAAGTELVVSAAGTVAGERAELSGTVAVPQFSPRSTLEKLGEPPIETADPTVLGAMELEADWNLVGDRVEVSPLRVRLDDSLLTGKLTSNIANQATTFDFELDTINVDRYLAPTPEGAAESVDSAGEETELPVETLRELDVAGRVAIGQLLAGGLVLQNVVANVTARDGRIRIDPSTADVYGGRYEGTMQLDVTGAVPRATFAQSLASVQTGGMLADLYDTQNLQGLLQARVEGVGTGNTANQLLRSLDGSVVLDLDDAIYKGADVWYEIRKSVARIKGKPMPAAPADPQTEITALGFAGKLAEGILRSDRLVAEIPFIRVEGGGAFDLLQNQLDYRLQARMLSRPNFPDADDLADLERVTIPITVKGDAAAPTIGIDLQELAKDAAVQKVQDRLLKKLGLDEPEETGDAEGAQSGESNATGQDEKPADARDLLKKGLRDLFDN